MNVTYQVNVNNRTNANYNYINLQQKYISRMYLSPKKKAENNYPYNYGMRHYYSAEIKPNSKMNQYQKPIYILNPYFVETQLTPIKSYNKNSLYNINNRYEVRTQKTFNNINNIIPQTNVNQTIIKNNINNSKEFVNNFYSYRVHTINTNQIPNKINQRMSYGLYTNPYKDNNIDVNNNYITNNHFNMIQKNIKIGITEKKNYNFDNIIENEIFNNTMPHLTRNEEMNIFKDERMTYQGNLTQIQPFKLFQDNNNENGENNNLPQNIIQNTNIIEDEKQKNIINNNNNMNIIKSINNWNNINLNIFENENNISEKEMNNYENNLVINAQIYDFNSNNKINETNELNEINYGKNETETTSINIYNNNYNNANNYIFNDEINQLLINLDKNELNEIKNEDNIFETQTQNMNLNNNLNLINNNINNIINQEKEEIINNQIQNIIIEEKTPIFNIENEKEQEKENVKIKKEELEISLNTQDNNLFESRKEQFDKNKFLIERQNKIEINPTTPKTIDNNSSKNNNSINSKSNFDNKNHNNNDKINDINNNKGNHKNEKQTNKNNIKLKKRRRPVYKIPPSKKRSISEGKSLGFIHKYYDENFILEEENEENSNDDENKKSNKDIISKNMSEKVFKEVKVRKVKKINDSKNN